MPVPTFPRQFVRWLNVPAGVLILLLQRTPAVRWVLAIGDTLPALRAGEVLRAAVATAALGAVDSLAGATTYVQNPPNPVQGTVGTRLSAAFAFVGAPSDAQYWMVLSGALPPGLSFVPAAIGGTIRAQNPAITGTPTQAGDFAVTVRAIGLAGQSDPVDIRFQITGGAPQESRLSNLSVRTTLAADQPLIVGFVVAGGQRSILVRAAGPALAAFGLASTMADPRLELYDGTQLVFENNDWPSTLAATFTSVGAFGFATGSRDAAMLQAVSGSRSIVARGPSAGLVLVETYDTGAGNTPRLINVSARNRVGVGDAILIAGFNIAGNASKQLLVRAVGPKLAAFGVPGVLANPKLELYSAAGVKLDENDDWAAALAATFTSVGAFQLDPGSRDAALLVTLSPGAYSAQVSGVGGTTGEALVEVYEVGGAPNAQVAISR